MIRDLFIAVACMVLAAVPLVLSATFIGSLMHTGWKCFKIHRRVERHKRVVTARERVIQAGRVS